MAGARYVRRRQNLRERGEGEADEVDGDSYAQVSIVPCAGLGVLGMMIRIQGTPGWADDPVQQQCGRIWMGRKIRSWFPPWSDIGQKVERVGRV